MNAFRFAIALACATFVLLVVGGTVNPTGSSLACPDWPTCHGSFFPEMTGGVRYEHTHRIVATLIGALTVVLAVMLWRTPHRTMALWALGVVIFQGVLGGVTVLLGLNALVSLTHLAISMAFFLFTIAIAFRLWPGRARSETAPTTAPRALPMAAAVGVYVQILLGGLVRHSGSGQACGVELPWCHAEAWPDLMVEKIHMIHRYGAVLVSLLVLVAAANAAWHALKSGKSLAFQASFIAPWLLLIQVVLGVMTVQSRVGVVEVTAHLAVGALLLAAFYMTYLGLGPQVDRVRVPAPAPTSAPVLGARFDGVAS